MKEPELTQKNSMMNFDSSILHINMNTVFDLNGEKISLADMVNQYQMSKKYCGNDWENCKPRLEQKAFDLDNVGKNENFDPNEKLSLSEPKTVFNSNSNNNNNALTSKEEVNNILDGKGNSADTDIYKLKKETTKPNMNDNIRSYGAGILNKGQNQAGDYYGRVDPLKNEIILD